jgi:hypothetical protein
VNADNVHYDVTDPITVKIYIDSILLYHSSCGLSSS